MADTSLSPVPLPIAPRPRNAGARNAGARASLREDQQLLQVSLTADTLRRYPGEPLRLFARVEALAELQAGLSLRITTPPGLRVDEWRAPDALAIPGPTVETFGDSSCPGQILTWKIEPSAVPESPPASDGQRPAPARFDFEIVGAVEQDVARVALQMPGGNLQGANGAAPPAFMLDCLAEAQARFDGAWVTRSQTLSIQVSPRAGYLRHLPGIYEADELVSRLLMLFESFWGPIEQQITNIHYYLDPRMTPAALLPWLASWADWVMDERWPEARQRQLAQALVSLYRRRGTPRGLREMLALYTGLDPDGDAIEIVEHRANNFVLGPTACLGPGVALGTRNVPHTFSVRLRLPRLQSHGSPAEAEREEARRRQTIEDIIEMEKPAHTRCALQIVLEDEA